MFPPGVCKAFGSVYVKSRSSTSFTSEIKDFIAPVPVSIANCSRIIVEKVTVPSPDPTNTSFPFTASYNAAGFSLKNGESNDSGEINAGTYSVAETPVPANWALTSATCSDGSDPASIDLGPAETVTCTFTNTLQTGAIQVHKTAKHAAAPGVDREEGQDDMRRAVVVGLILAILVVAGGPPARANRPAAPSSRRSRMERRPGGGSS